MHSRCIQGLEGCVQQVNTCINLLDPKKTETGAPQPPPSSSPTPTSEDLGDTDETEGVEDTLPEREYSSREWEHVLTTVCNNLPRQLKRDANADFGWSYAVKGGKAHAHVLMTVVPKEGCTVQMYKERLL